MCNCMSRAATSAAPSSPGTLHVCFTPPEMYSTVAALALATVAASKETTMADSNCVHHFDFAVCSILDSRRSIITRFLTSSIGSSLSRANNGDCGLGSLCAACSPNATKAGCCQDQQYRGHGARPRRLPVQAASHISRGGNPI